MNKELPFSTDHNVDHPVSLYAATKKSNELMAHTYSHLYGLPTTGLRFFTVYGPWGRPDMAYYLFAEAIHKGEAIKVFNNGKIMRDFTYINDIVQGVVKTIDKAPLPNPDDQNDSPGRSKTPYRVFNIGNNEPVNLLKFIEIMEEVIGKKIDKIMMPMQDGDVPSTYAD
jgi:UDP-glucuronate 4-epimerase